VFIIDEVHMLSQAAFNAFLKTLEEPPEYAIFILATTEKQKVIPTILSRCQIYDFVRITVPDIVRQLQYVCEQEHVTAEPAALNVIAQKADGAMRDALSIFDQVAASTQGNITYQSALDNLNVLDYDYYFNLVETFLSGDVQQALLIYKEIRDKGFDSQFFVNGLAQHLRDLMVAGTPKTRKLLEMNDEVAQRYAEQSACLSPQFFYRALDLCNTCDLNYRNASSKQLLVELTLVKLCQLVENPVPAAPSQSALKKVQPAPAGAAPTAAPHAAPQASAAKPAPAAPAPASASQPTAPSSQHPASPASAQVATSQPATAPKPAQASPTQTGARPKPTGMRVMLNSAPADDSATKPVAAASQQRTQAFSAEQLLQAWQAYIDVHPQEKALLTTMNYAKPSRLDSDTHYSLVVSSPGEQRNIDEHKAALMGFLHDKLNNDQLTIDVTVSEAVVPPRTLSSREVLEDMKERMPGFKDFMKDFDLQLN